MSMWKKKKNRIFWFGSVWGAKMPVLLSRHIIVGRNFHMKDR